MSCYQRWSSGGHLVGNTCQHTHEYEYINNTNQTHALGMFSRVFGHACYETMSFALLPWRLMRQSSTGNARNKPRAQGSDVHQNWWDTHKNFSNNGQNNCHRSLQTYISCRQTLTCFRVSLMAFLSKQWDRKIVKIEKILQKPIKNPSCRVQNESRNAGNGCILSLKSYHWWNATAEQTCAHIYTHVRTATTFAQPR